MIPLIGAINSFSRDSLPPLLLDNFPSAFGVSLRQLKTGATSAFKVRRTSDSAEQDIGFNGNGDLNTAALDSFCTGTNGLITTWYDQSGNANDATQTTEASMPKIYDSSTGYLEEVSFIGAKWLEGANNIASGSRSIYIVGAVDSLVQGNFFCFRKTSPIFNVSRTEFAGVYFYYTDGIDANRNWATSNSIPTGVFSISSILFLSGNNLEVYENNSLRTRVNGSSPPSADTGTTGYYLGRREQPPANFNLNGSMKEFIVYDDYNDSDRLDVQNNINSYYSIY